MKRLFGTDGIRSVAGKRDVGWRANLRAVMESIGTETTFVWVLHDRATPRKDALGALIRDGSRVDASVTGSKILDSEDPVAARSRHPERLADWATGLGDPDARWSLRAHHHARQSATLRATAAPLERSITRGDRTRPHDASGRKLTHDPREQRIRPHRSGVRQQDDQILGSRRPAQ